MEQWNDIRHRVLKEGVSKRQILRETGMHWRTLEKILSNSAPPGYRRTKSIRKPKIDLWMGRKGKRGQGTFLMLKYRKSLCDRCLWSMITGCF